MHNAECIMQNYWVLLFHLRRNSKYLFTITFFSCGKLSLPTTDVGIELSSRAASRKVFSPLQSLTSVFGMGTGGPSALKTLTITATQRPLLVHLQGFEPGTH